MKLTCVIIDDEFDARAVLSKLLELHFPNVEVVGMADNVGMAVSLIQIMEPDFILLDIEMPQQNGFALLQQFPNPSFQTIFVTAYQQYAIQAFRASAVDYILKPVDLDILEEAIRKVGERKGHKEKATLENEMKMEALRENMRDERVKSIIVQTNDQIKLISIDDIFYLKSERVYSHIYHTKGHDVLVKSLNYFEEMLGATSFFRIHRSYLINTTKIKRILTRDTNLVELHEGHLLPIARDRKTDFVEFLSGRGS